MRNLLRSSVGILSAAGLLTLAATSVQAQIVIEFAAAPNGPSITGMNMAPGVTSIDLVRGPGIVSPGGVNSTFNSTNFTVGASSFDAAIAAGDYLLFGFTSTTAFDLTDIDLRYDRSNTGPNQARLDIDTGSGFVPVFTDTSVNTAGEDNIDIDLSSFDNVFSATFRLSAFGATNAGGTFDIETINFNSGGTYGIQITGAPVAAPAVVPEPGTFALVGVGALAMAGMVARRRKANNAA